MTKQQIQVKKILVVNRRRKNKTKQNKNYIYSENFWHITTGVATQPQNLLISKNSKNSGEI